MSKPIVYGGASIAFLPGEIIKLLEVRPPAKHGDFVEWKDHAPAVMVIIDGFFSMNRAVTPMECREMIQAGWTMIGASSMGALRASELWPVGMIGVGTIYQLYRTGALTSDADVAVAMSEDSLKELTISIAHLAATLGNMERIQLIEPAESRKLLKAARSIYFMDRTWRAVLDAWKDINVSERQCSMLKGMLKDPALHPKILDAHEAVSLALNNTWPHPIAVIQEKETIEKYSYMQYKTCKVCYSKIAGTALFCPICASDAHQENFF